MEPQTNEYGKLGGAGLKPVWGPAPTMNSGGGGPTDPGVADPTISKPRVGGMGGGLESVTERISTLKVTQNLDEGESESAYGKLSSGATPIHLKGKQCRTLARGALTGRWLLEGW